MPDRSTAAFRAAFPDVRPAPIATLNVPLVRDNQSIGGISASRENVAPYDRREIALQTSSEPWGSCSISLTLIWLTDGSMPGSPGGLRSGIAGPYPTILSGDVSAPEEVPIPFLVGHPTQADS